MKLAIYGSFRPNFRICYTNESKPSFAFTMEMIYMHHASVLLIEILPIEFPDNLLNAVKEDKNNKLTSINLIFAPTKDREDVFSAAHLDKVVREIKPKFLKNSKPKIVIDPMSFKKLEEQDIAIMFNNPDFILMLSDDSFKRLITSSKQAAALALENRYILERLNNSDKKSDAQTFERSCAARCIMKILLEHALIPKEKYTRAFELEIYQNIWFAPGRDADSQRIISYLQQYKFKIGGLEISKRAASLVEEETAQGNYGYQKLYSFFKESVKTPIIEMKDSIDESIFKEGLSFLLVEKSELSTHIVIAKKLNNKMFEITDPDTGQKHQYASFKEYDQQKKFSGIAFTLNLSS